MSKAPRRPSNAATIHDQKLERGEGGELHQLASHNGPILTTAQGGPVSDDQNSLKIGPRGPTVLEDFHFPSARLGLTLSRPSNVTFPGTLPAVTGQRFSHHCAGAPDAYDLGAPLQRIRLHFGER